MKNPHQAAIAATVFFVALVLAGLAAAVLSTAACCIGSAVGRKEKAVKDQFDGLKSKAKQYLNHLFN